MSFEQPEQKILNFFLLLICLFIVLQYLYSFGVLCFKGEFGDFKTVFAQSKILDEIRHIQSYQEIDKITVAKEHAWLFSVLICPPIFYLIFFRISKLFSFFPLHLQAISWLWLTQGFLLGAALLLVKTVKSQKTTFLEKSLVAFLILSYLPVKFNNELAQTWGLILFLLSLAIFSFKKQREALAGILIALATCLKWTPGILFLFLLVKKAYRAVIAGLVTLFLAFLVSLLYYGMPIHLLTIKSPFTTAASYFSIVINHSLAGFWGRIFTIGGEIQGLINFPRIGWFFTLVSVLTLIFLSCRIASKKINRTDHLFVLEYALFVILLLLCSSQVSIYHLTILLIPIILCTLISFQEPGGKFLFPFLIGGYLLTGLEYWPDGLELFRKGWGVLFLSGRFYGTLLLWLGIYLFLKKHPKSN